MPRTEFEGYTLMKTVHETDGLHHYWLSKWSPEGGFFWSDGWQDLLEFPTMTALNEFVQKWRHAFVGHIIPIDLKLYNSYQKKGLGLA